MSDNQENEYKYKTGIEFQGKHYRSKAELAKHFGVRYDTFIQRMGRGWTMEESLGIVPKSHLGQKITINDQTFNSKKEAADSLGIRPDELTNLLNDNKLPKSNRKPVIVDGVQYKSKAEAMRELNLERWQLDAILNNKPKRATEITVIVDDKEQTFVSIRQFCKTFDIEYSRTCGILKKGLMTPQQVLDKKLYAKEQLYPKEEDS